MTREQKLGLIIGFAVVLVFGVLIADHFSRARTEPLIAADPIDEPLVIPTVSGLRPASGGSLPRLAEPLTPAAGGGPGGAGPSVAPPPENRAAPIGRRRFAEGTRGAIDLDSIFEPAGPAVPGGAEAGPRPRGDAGVLPGFVRVDDGAGRIETVPVARGPERGPVREPEVERVRTHRVKKGENLYRIAEKYYGNGHLWRRLAKANNDVVTADGQVAQDALLRIPSVDSISGSRAPSAAAPRRAAAASSDFEVGTYTVQKGDTLSEISQKLLGTVRRMDDLIRMNSDLIDDADDIRVGMTLRYERGPET